MDFKNKYLKYKNKYLNLKKEYEMIGGLTRDQIIAARSRLRPSSSTTNRTPPPRPPRLTRPSPRPPPPKRGPGYSPKIKKPTPSPGSDFTAIFNNGSLDELPGVSNSCMWISILHYLRLYGGYGDLTLEQLRIIGGVNDPRYNHEQFDSINDIMVRGILEICRVFNIQINVYAVGADRSLTLTDVFPHPSGRGDDYNPDHIVNIASYGRHFELISQSNVLGVNLDTSSPEIVTSGDTLVFDNKEKKYINEDVLLVEINELYKKLDSVSGSKRLALEKQIESKLEEWYKIGKIVSDNVEAKGNLGDIEKDFKKRIKFLEEDIAKSNKLLQELKMEGITDSGIIRSINDAIKRDESEIKSLQTNLKLM